MPDWDRYLPGYHDANPGITEDVLAGALDAAGRSPYDWLLEAFPAGATAVVDLACGSGPLGRRLVAAGVGVVGVDRSAGELTRASGSRVQAIAHALPLAGGWADAVVCSMALMLMNPLDAVLGEVVRVLRPGGTFVATVPTRTAGAPAFVAVLRALGQAGVGYPEPLDDAGGQLAASALHLESDEAEVFTRTVADAGDAELVVRGLYAPGAGPDQVAAAIDHLRRAAPVDMGYRIRRLVARRVRD